MRSRSSRPLRRPAPGRRFTGTTSTRPSTWTKAFVPRGTPHTFANLRDAPARQLIVCTPAGFERYFAHIAGERKGIDPPDGALQPIPEVTRLGPTLAERLAGER